MRKLDRLKQVDINKTQKKISDGSNDLGVSVRDKPGPSIPKSYMVQTVNGRKVRG